MSFFFLRTLVSFIFSAKHSPHLHLSIMFLIPLLDVIIYFMIVSLCTVVPSHHFFSALFEITHQWFPQCGFLFSLFCVSFYRKEPYYGMLDHGKFVNVLSIPYTIRCQCLVALFPLAALSLVTKAVPSVLIEKKDALFPSVCGELVRHEDVRW